VGFLGGLSLTVWKLMVWLLTFLTKILFCVQQKKEMHTDMRVISGWTVSLRAEMDESSTLPDYNVPYFQLFHNHMPLACWISQPVQRTQDVY